MPKQKSHKASSKVLRKKKNESYKEKDTNE